MIDDSYVKASYSQTAYDIMSDGIFEKLEHLPKYHDEVERMKEDAQNTQLIFYLKPTTQWKL